MGDALCWGVSKHIGFGKVSNEAKNVQVEFLEQVLGSIA